MTGSIDRSVTLDDVFVVVGARRVPLAPELAGYLALEVAEGSSAPGGEIDPKSVFISEEGTVALVRAKDAAGDAEACVRTFLLRLLEASGSQTPALGAAARRKAGTGMRALVEELEAALIPVNRAAGRRALARLAREVKRVTAGVGRNAAPPERPGVATIPRPAAPTPPPPSSVRAPTPPPPPTEEDFPDLDLLPRGPSAAPPEPLVEETPAPPPEEPVRVPTPGVPRVDAVDELLASFEVSGAATDRAVSRELKAMVGIDPTPAASPAAPRDAIDSLLAISDKSIPIANVRRPPPVGVGTVRYPGMIAPGAPPPPNQGAPSSPPQPAAMPQAAPMPQPMPMAQAAAMPQPMPMAQPAPMPQPVPMPPPAPMPQASPMPPPAPMPHHAPPHAMPPHSSGAMPAHAMAPQHHPASSGPHPSAPPQIAPMGPPGRYGPPPQPAQRVSATGPAAPAYGPPPAPAIPSALPPQNQQQVIMPAPGTVGGGSRHAKTVVVREYKRKRASRIDRVLAILTLLVLIGGVVAVWLLKPGFFTGRTPDKLEQERQAAALASAQAAAAQQQVRCKATLGITDVPANAEVLLRVGQAPVDIERMPVGARLEFVATAEGFAPKRSIIQAGATWDTGPDGKPRYELAVQLEPTRAKAGAVDPWPAGEPGSVVGGKGAPGTVHVVSTPRGAEMWLLVGAGPEASIDPVRCDLDADILVAGPTTFRRRLHVSAQDIAKAPVGQGGGHVVKLSSLPDGPPPRNK